MFSKGAVAVISFAVWEEGIVTAAGNPKRIRGIEDLARRDVAMVNREKGAGSRACWTQPSSGSRSSLAT